MIGDLQSQVISEEEVNHEEYFYHFFYSSYFRWEVRD